MPRSLKRGILGASTIILSKDIDKYAFMCGSNFYETDINLIYRPKIYLILYPTLENLTTHIARMAIQQGLTLRG